MDSPAPTRSGLTKQQTRSTLASFNWNLCLRGVFDVTCGGTTFVFVAFALALGVPRERMGVITSVVSAACILQIVSIGLNRRVRDKKKFVLALALTEPLLMIAAVLTVPFLPPALRIYALATAAFTAAGTLHLTRPVLDEWVASAIPAGLRGRYLGRRSQYLATTTIATTLALGWASQRVAPNDAFGFALILATGGFFGFLAALPLRNASLPAMTAQASAEWADLPRVFKNASFRRFMLATHVVSTPFFFSVPYYQVFHLEVLELPKATIAYISVTYMVAKIAMLPLMGRRVARWGSRRVLKVAGVMYVLFFMGFPLAAAGGMWAVAAAWIVAGVADGAWNVAWTSAMYSAVPGTRDRPAYFAVSNLVLLSMYALGGIISMPLLRALRGVEMQIGPFTLGQFHVYFLGIAALMVPCLLGTRLFVGRRHGASRAGKKGRREVTK